MRKFYLFAKKNYRVLCIKSYGLVVKYILKALSHSPIKYPCKGLYLFRNELSADYIFFFTSLKR